VTVTTIAGAPGTVSAIETVNDRSSVTVLSPVIGMLIFCSVSPGLNVSVPVVCW
jgi:hypothetical protein